MSYCVYKHESPNGKVYIGITGNNPIERWGNGYHYSNNQHFYRAILKYGWDNMKHEILFTDLTKEEACEKEIELIAKYQSNNPNYGYNHALGGDINVGWHHSEKSKIKMRKPKSDQTKFRMSEAGKKRGQPKQWNRRGKEPWNKGKKLDYENNFTQNRKRVINLDTGEVFESINNARDKYNAVKISQVCMGKRNRSGGYRWAYFEGGDV